MYVSATIGGDSLDPDFWTPYFGVIPQISTRKGDEYVIRGTKLKKRTGVWGTYRIKILILSNDASVHAQYIIDLLKLPRVGRRGLLRKHRVGMRFFYYVNSEEENNLEMPNEMKGLLASCGIDVQFDIY